MKMCFFITGITISLILFSARTPITTISSPFFSFLKSFSFYVLIGCTFIMGFTIFIEAARPKLLTIEVFNC
jgi:hypothetical protein